MNDIIIHVVEQGQTIEEICAMYSVPVSVTSSNNGVSEQNPITPGQALLILLPTKLYNVKSGDSVFSIAAQNGISLNELYRNNFGLSSKDAIFIGQTLAIEYQNTKYASFKAGGYAYPFISAELLESALPYLNYLMPFTYGFDNNGTLIGIDDSDLILKADLFGVMPYMHISTLGSDGTFSNTLASLVINDSNLQDTLINNILINLSAKGYRGLDIDFEFVLASDRDAYSAFIKKLTTILNQNGYEVIVALPPKTSDDQKGLLYEGIDYAALGNAANRVLLMTYEWGYSKGPPLAIAPVPSVRRVLDYAISRIEPGKIFMGMPNYGYDWTLPYQRGNPPAPSISTVEAISLARNYGAVIMYDEVSQAPYFNYTDQNNINHEVWFEDTRSAAAKLSLVSEYGFYGVLYWDLMRQNPQNYTTLNALINTRQ